MKLFIALSAVAAAAANPQPTAVSRDSIANRVNSLTSAVSDSASKLERAERASVTKERMAQWTNFIADVEEHIPELLQDTATVAGSSAQLYEPLDFPAFVSAAPPAGSTWNPFEPWLVQLKAYRTYMANYIDYQITWVYKLKCTFTGDCNVHTTMSFAASGATKLVLGSAAGIAKDDKLMVPGTATATAASAFLEAATGSGSCYTVTAVSGNTVTISPGLKAEAAEGTAVTKSTACGVSASPSPAAGGAFGASSLTLFKRADLSVAATADVVAKNGAATPADQTTKKDALIPADGKENGCGAACTTAFDAAAEVAMALKFTPAAKIDKDSIVKLTLGDSGNCRYSLVGSAAEWNAAWSTTPAGAGIFENYAPSADAAGADAAKKLKGSTTFTAFGDAGSVATAEVTAAGASISLKALADIAAGTAVNVLIAPLKAAGSNPMIKTPTADNKCKANDPLITLQVIKAGGVSVAATAVTKSPATA